LRFPWATTKNRRQSYNLLASLDGILLATRKNQRQFDGLLASLDGILQFPCATRKNQRQFDGLVASLEGILLLRGDEEEPEASLILF
jgi:hypothetical protein